MKTLPLSDLPTTNDQLVKDYGDILQSMFGYDVIVLRNYDTAESHGLFSDGLLNRLITDGILSIANYTRGATGGIETTLELTALGFVTKAMSVQQKILAGAAYYRRDVDADTDVTGHDPVLAEPIELDPPAPVIPAATDALQNMEQRAPEIQTEDRLSRDDQGQDDDTLELHNEANQREAGFQADVHAPQAQSVPSGYGSDTVEFDRSGDEEAIISVDNNGANGDQEDGRHAFLVPTGEDNQASEADEVDELDNGPVSPLTPPVDSQGGEDFEIPKFLQRARDENKPS